jgi:hypothetical protein
MIAAVYRVYPLPPAATARLSFRMQGKEAIASPLRAMPLVLASLIGTLRVTGYLVVTALVWVATSRHGRWVRVTLAVMATYQIASLIRDIPRATERKRLVRMVDDFHNVQGRYPASLEEAGVSHDPAVFTVCDYYVEERGATAYLKLSDGFLSDHWNYDFRRGRWECYYD